MLRSPIAEESALRTESKPGMARSATRAPRSAGCSYARELMSGKRIRPRRTGRDSAVMPSSVRARGSRAESEHVLHHAGEEASQLGNDAEPDPDNPNDDARECFAVLEARSPRNDECHDAQHQSDGGRARNNRQDQANDAEGIAGIGGCWLRGGLVVGHDVSSN